MLIDTHVHMDDAKFDVDRDEVLRRAREAGVGTLVTIGTNLEDSAWNVRWVAGQPGAFATVGLHPELARRWKEGDEAEFEALAKNGKVMAIGEVGLDYHHPGFDKGLQLEIFRKMIRLAGKLALPLVIHQRDAAQDTLGILREESAGANGGVFHCFAGDLDCARGAVALGFDIAVGGILTFPSAGNLREVIRQLPLDRLVLETDAPWLAPQTMRGRRNEPAFMTAVAEKLAEVQGVGLAEIERITTANAKRIFRIL